MKVIGRFLLVKPDEAAKEVKGFIIPEVAREKVNSGIVRGVGGKVEDINNGDRVVYHKYANVTATVEFNGEDVIVIHESAIELTIENK